MHYKSHKTGNHWNKQDGKLADQVRLIKSGRRNESIFDFYIFNSSINVFTLFLVIILIYVFVIPRCSQIRTDVLFSLLISVNGLMLVLSYVLIALSLKHTIVHSTLCTFEDEA